MTNRIVDFAAATADVRKRKKRQPPGEPPPAPPKDDRRPVIRAFGGSLPDNVDAAVSALSVWAKHNPVAAVYVQEGAARLVRGVRVAEPGGLKLSGGFDLPAGTFCLREPSADMLAALLGRAARFQKYDRRAEAWAEIDAPERMVRAVMGAAPWPGLPVLAGVTTAPTMRRDGSVLQQPGYDEPSRLLYQPTGGSFTRVAETPSRDAAIKALEALVGLLEWFPFKDAAADRSVALAAILAAIIRPALAACPLFLFTAPKPRTGKTLLAELPSRIATGGVPATLSQSSSPEEERKRLLAALLSAPRAVLFDNLTRALRSDALCSIITGSAYTDRLLGVSEQVTVGTSVLWLATGNNATVAGDLAARTLECRLDAGVAEPGEREIPLDLNREIARRRGELVAAGLTIVRYYIAAGAPSVDLPRWGGFESFDRLVRAPLVYLGEVDPGAVRERVRRGDVDGQRLITLLAAWLEMFGPECSETIGRALAKARDGRGIDQDAPANRLFEAAVMVAERGGEPDVQKVGRFMAAHLDRWEIETDADGIPLKRLCFREAPRARSGVRAWFVQVADPD